MTAVPIPPDEAARLATLHALGLLDTPREPAFDDLTRLASDLLDMPIALISLVDEHRQWFKAAVGVSIAETPREQAFCAHAIAREGPFEIRDAREDPRFRDNPLVVGEPRIRFYAGVPLRVDGRAVGTLCVIDRDPRRLDGRQRATLERLAGLAASLLGRRRDEASLRRAHGRLADFVVSSGDWLWETRGLRLSWVSDNVTRVLGVTPDAYVGHLLVEALIDDDPPVREANARALAAIRARRPFHDLVVRRSIAGGERVVAKSGVPVHGVDRTFAGWRGVARDVTAAHEARRDAARAERRLREAVEALDEPFVMTDPQGRIVLTNARWRASNVAPGEPMPQRWDEHMRRLLDTGRLENAQGREAEWIEQRIARRGTCQAPHEARVGGRDYLISDLVLSDGSCVTVGQDITAIRAEQRAALDAIRRLELAVAVAGLTICEIDLDGGTFRFVAGWSADAGGTPSPHVLADALATVVPHERERFETGLRDVWEGRRDVYRDEIGIDHAGMLRRMRFDIALEREPDGGGRRLVGVRADVTKLRQTEAAARQKTAADLANRAKSEFLSRVGHELRTPLNAIRGLAQVLQRETADGGALRHALIGHIVSASEHLAALLDDLLDMAQVEAGRLTIRAEPIALAPVMRECLRMIAPQAAGHGIALECGRVPESLRVMADATRLRQILLNLVSNAVKYNRPRGRVRLEASADSGDGFARVAVTDTGPGLTRDEIGRVFRPFERLAHDEGRAREGLGLGLSIAQGLAQAMGGAIDVDSVPGRGTTFTVRLPALPALPAGSGDALPGADRDATPMPGERRASAGDAGRSASAAADAGGGTIRDGPVRDGMARRDGAIPWDGAISRDDGAPRDGMVPRDGTIPRDGMSTRDGAVPRDGMIPWNGAVRDAPVRGAAPADDGVPSPAAPDGIGARRVLYVEDNRLNGVLMKQIALQVPGLVLQVVESGEEALAMLTAFAPDLLLLDNDLPGISGLETHRLLKADPRWASLPVVLVSADATAEAIARARALGFDDYWVKPIDVARVIEALGRVAARPGARAPTGA